MTPSLRKSIELLQLSKFELLEEIKHYQDENPFIKNINENEEFFELDYENFSEEVNLQEHLLKQIFDLSLEKEDEEMLQEALRGISYVPSQKEVVKLVAKRVARRLQEAKRAEARLNRALGKRR